MTKQMLMAARVVAVLAITTASVGCRTAEGVRDDARSAANTVGDAAEAVFTDQGAETVVPGTIAELDRRTRAVLQEMGMTITKVEDERDGREREFEARAGDRVVRVELEWVTANTTEVEVSYREGRLDYDKQQASNILRRIQQRR